MKGLREMHIMSLSDVQVNLYSTNMNSGLYSLLMDDVKILSDSIIK